MGEARRLAIQVWGGPSAFHTSPRHTHTLSSLFSHIIEEWVFLSYDNVKLPSPTQNKNRVWVLSRGQTYHCPIKAIWALTPPPLLPGLQPPWLPQLPHFIVLWRRKKVWISRDTSRVDEGETELANTGLETLIAVVTCACAWDWPLSVIYTPKLLYTVRKFSSVCKLYNTTATRNEQEGVRD